MRRLDPLTNLPEQNNINRANADLLDTVVRPSQTSLQPVEGAFGKYKPGLNVASDRNFNELRAQGQTGLELIGKGLANGIGGVIVGGSIAGVGYMLDAPQYMGRLFFGERDEQTGAAKQPFERNAISRIGHAIEDYFFSNFEVYQTERAQEGGFNPFASGSRLRDGTFWASHLPSIVSTVSLMIPSYAVGRGISMGARALGAGQSAQRAITTIGAAIANRHNYNMMEGFDLMDRRMQELTEQGFSYNEAKERAAQASSSFYKTAYANLWKDLASWTALLRGVNYASRATRQSITNLENASGNRAISAVQDALRRNPSISIKQAVERAGYTWRDFALQAGLEGFEEFNIQFQKSVAERNSDILMGLEEGDYQSFFDAYFSSQSIDALLNDKEIQNATLMGFLGGGIFQAVGGTVARLKNRRQLANAAEEASIIEKQIKNIQNSLKTIETATNEGNLEAAELQRERDILAATISGAKGPDGVNPSLLQGDTANLLEMYEAVANMTDSEIAELGLGDPAQARENAKWAIREINKISEIYNELNEKYYGDPVDGTLNVIMTEEKYLAQKAGERRSRLDTKRAEYLASEEVANAYNALEGDSKTYVDKKIRLYHLQQLIARVEKGLPASISKGLNKFRLGLLNTVQSKLLSEYKSEIETLQAEIKELSDYKEGRNFESNHLRNEGFNETMTQLMEAEYQEKYSNAMLPMYRDEGVKNNLRLYLTQKENTINNATFNYLMKQEFIDGGVVRIGDEVYKISHKEDSIELESIVDGKLTGETQPLTREMIQSGDTIREDIYITELGELIPSEEKQAKLDEFESALKSNDFDSALKASESLYISGILSTEEVKANRDKIEEAIKAYISKSRDFRTLREQMGKLFRQVRSTALRNSIANAMNEHREQLVAQLVQEQKRFTAMMKKNENEQRKAKEELKNINESLKQIKEELNNFETETALQLLGDTYNDLVSQRDTAIAEATTPIKKAQAGKKFKTDLRKELSAAFRKKRSKAAKQAKQKLEQLNESKNQLQARKRQITEQRKQFDINAKIYNELKENFENLNETEVYDTVVGDKLVETKRELEYLAARFMDEANVDTNKLKGDLAELEANLEQGIQHVTELALLLNDLVRSNDMVAQAVENALLSIFENESLAFTSIEAIPQELLNIFKSRVQSELTKLEPSKENKAVQKAIKQVRRKIAKVQNIGDISLYHVNEAAYQDIYDAYFKDFADRHGRNLIDTKSIVDRINYLERAAGVYETILEQMRIAVTEAMNNVDATGKNYKHSINPKRNPDYVYEILAGKSHKDGVWQDDVDQTRYFNFMNSINLYEADLSFQIFNASDLGLTFETKTEDAVLVAVAVNSEGKYYTEDGVSDTFDRNKSVYTTLPDAQSSIIQYATEKSTKNKLFPGVNEATQNKALQELVEHRKEEYAKFKANLVERLAKGENVVVGLATDNIVQEGFPIMEDDTNFSTNSLNNPDAVIPSEYEVVVATGEETTFVTPNGIEFTSNTKPGNVYAHEHKTGRIYPLQTRPTSNSEIDTVIDALKYYANRIRLGHRGVDAVRLIDKNGEFIPDRVREDKFYSFISVINSVTNRIQIDLKKNTITVVSGWKGKGDNKTPIGTTLNILNENNQISASVITLIRAELASKPVNINRIRYNNNEAHYTFERSKDGPFEVVEHKSYREYVKNQNMLGTWVKKPKEKQMETSEKTGVVVTEPQFMNRNVRIDIGEYRDENYIPPILKKENTSEDSKDNTKKKKNPFDVLPVNSERQQTYSFVLEKAKENTVKSKKEALKKLSKTIEIGGEKTNEVNLLLAHTNISVESLQENVKKLNEEGDNEIINKLIKTWLGLNSNLKTEKIESESSSKPLNVENLLSLKNKIEKTDNLAPIMDEVFSILNEQDYISWQENMSEAEMNEYAVDMRRYKSREDAANALSKKLLSAYIDVKIAEIENTSSKPPISSSKEKKSLKERRDNLEDMESPFLRETVTGLTSRAKATRTMSNLSKRTGMKFENLSVEQSLAFLNKLKEEGVINETFTEETLPHGTVYKNTVYTFGEIHTETLFHEVAHPIVAEIIKNNPKLFNTLKNEIRKNDPKIIEHVLKNYPDPFDANGAIKDSTWNEIITTAIGKEATNQYENKTLSDTIVELWERIKEYFKQIMGTDVAFDINALPMNATVGDISNLLTKSPQRITGMQPKAEPQMQRQSLETYTMLGSELNAEKTLNDAKTENITIGNPRTSFDNLEGITYTIQINGKNAGFFITTAFNAHSEKLSQEKGFISGSMGIPGVELFEEFRGKGYGKQIYLAMAKELAKQNISLKSEFFGLDSIGPASTKIWENLVKEGFAFKNKDYYEILFADVTYTYQQYQQDFDYSSIKTNSGKLLSEIGISEETWYITPSEVKEHILNCN